MPHYSCPLTVPAAGSAPPNAGARTLNDLSAKWAVGTQYGARLMEMLAQVPVSLGY